MGLFVFVVAKLWFGFVLLIVCFWQLIQEIDVVESGFLAEVVVAGGVFGLAIR